MRRSSSSLSFLCWSKLGAANFSTLILCILILSSLSFAAAPDRITAPIAAAQSVRLAAGVPLQARPEFDQGAVDPSLQLSYITLLTVPSASQKRAVNKLLADQQNPRSASYHKWLTPEQYADRFGLSPNDIQKLTAWLQSQGFTVVRAARGRNWIAFSGTAAQVDTTFQTQIHNFKVEGEMHFANTTPPTIPAALSGIVTGFRGFNDFRPKSQAHRAQPGYTFPSGVKNYHFISPGDITAMYDLSTLYGSGIDGTGYTLAVIGETGIYQSDLTNFRQNFGLSAISCTTSSDVITACNTSNFKYVLVNGLATTIRGDLPEADIDIEWSGATARNAQVIYVTANATNVFDSLYYTIDNDLSKVMTMSYSAPCELFEIGSFAADEAELQKANTEGITFLNSSGDTGAAECDYRANIAVYGYAVGYPSSSPSVTAVGGTMIPAIAPNEYGSTYWNPSNGSDGGSAKGYITEQPWNDAEEFGLICSQASPPSFCTTNHITNWATAQTFFGISAGGGGVSNCVTADANLVCLSGFPQPSWQAGLTTSAVNPGGLGAINATPTRYTPDVSLLASPNLPGYLLCSQINGSSGGGSSCDSPTTGIADMLTACLSTRQTGPCTIYGGTSVASPVFAGMVALLNQDAVVSGIQTTPGLGNINPMLYSLAAANSTNKAFNPVTTPNTGAYSNGAWCSPGTPTSGVTADPWPAALQCPSSGSAFLGFSAFNFDATTNYNLVSGLGSVNASHLAAAWVAASLASTTTTTVTSSANPANYGTSVTFTATVTTTGATPPTGTVTFNDGATALGTGTLSTVSGSQVATFTTSTLTAGTHSITAVYGGDSSNGGSTSPVLSQVIVAPTFAITTPSTPATPLSGQTTTSTFTVTPTGTTTLPITFVCNGVPDATVTCSAPSIAAGASGVQTVTLTITTTGPNSGTAASQKRRADNRSPWLPLTLPLAGIVMVGLAGRKMSKHSAIAGLCASLVLLGLLIACGGSNPPVTISVSPAGATVYASGPAADNWPPQTATFTPTVNNTSNTAVSWSLTSTVSCTGTPNPCGSIPGGVYTAPTAASGLPGSVTVTATSQADSTKTATATVTIKPTTVPGSYPLTVTATEGPTQNTTAAFTLTVK
jgi:Pro-kumamolisin, activation domain/Bacterial Ig-like domain (group 3)